jgi:putative ABC transport system permease protein
MQSLADVVDISVNETGFWVKALSVISAWVLLLALSGIYSVMSFAVSRRTREIGIRVALGSSRLRVVLAILRRPIVQISTGVVAGTIAGIAFDHMVSRTPVGIVNLSIYIAVIVVVCVLACLGPVRRALTVDPIAALRVD